MTTSKIIPKISKNDISHKISLHVINTYFDKRSGIRWHEVNLDWLVLIGGRLSRYTRAFKNMKNKLNYPSMGTVQMNLSFFAENFCHVKLSHPLERFHDSKFAVKYISSEEMVYVRLPDGKLRFDRWDIIPPFADEYNYENESGENMWQISPVLQLYYGKDKKLYLEIYPKVTTSTVTSNRFCNFMVDNVGFVCKIFEYINDQKDVVTDLVLEKVKSYVSKPDYP